MLASVKRKSHRLRQKLKEKTSPTEKAAADYAAAESLVSLVYWNGTCQVEEPSIKRKSHPSRGRAIRQEEAPSVKRKSYPSRGRGIRQEEKPSVKRKSHQLEQKPTYSRKRPHRLW